MRMAIYMRLSHLRSTRLENRVPPSKYSKSFKEAQTCTEYFILHLAGSGAKSFDYAAPLQHDRLSTETWMWRLFPVPHEEHEAEPHGDQDHCCRPMGLSEMRERAAAHQPPGSCSGHDARNASGVCSGTWLASLKDRPLNSWVRQRRFPVRREKRLR